MRWRSPGGPGQRVLVSAHRCGSGGDVHRENTRAALDQALRLDVDYVEMDVRACGDATLVLFHDPALLVDGQERDLTSLSFAEFLAQGPQFLRYDEVLHTLAGRAGAHIDLKVDDPAVATTVARLALDALGVDGFVITGNDGAVRHLRDWADALGIPLRLGLSLGGGFDGRPLRAQVARRVSEILPRRRLEASGADVLVVQWVIALLGAARWANRHDVPLLVWTVNASPLLRWWLRPGRAWMVTTNHPDVALRLRR